MIWDLLKSPLTYFTILSASLTVLIYFKHDFIRERLVRGSSRKRKIEIASLLLFEASPNRIEDTILKPNLLLLEEQQKGLDEPVLPANQSDADVARAEVGRLAKRWDELAAFFWGRSSARLCSISSHYYLLSATAYATLANAEKNIEHRRESARRYHWSANQFRNIGALDKGMEFYFESAKQYAEAASISDDDSRAEFVVQTRRSLERGMAICQSVGESNHIWIEQPGKTKKAPKSTSEKMKHEIGLICPEIFDADSSRPSFLLNEKPIKIPNN